MLLILLFKTFFNDIIILYRFHELILYNLDIFILCIIHLHGNNFAGWVIRHILVCAVMIGIQVTQQYTVQVLGVMTVTHVLPAPI